MRPRSESRVETKFPLRAAILSLSLLSGCASVSVQPLTAPGSNYRESPEETKLLERASNAHQELVSKGLLLKDEGAVAFIQRIGDSIVANDLSARQPITFHILRSPQKNALASPSGNIYVTVGLLVSLESEGQLAYVLAHEVAHIAGRHMYSAYLAERQGWKVALVGDILLLGTKLSYLPYIASLASYSREREIEADDEALIALKRAGRDPREAVSALNHLQEPRAKSDESSWLSTHPAIKERTNRISSRIEALPQSSAVGTDNQSYLLFRTGLLREAIQLNLYAQRYDEAARLAQRAIEETNDKSQAYYLLGESKRLFAMDASGAARDRARRNENSKNPSLSDTLQRDRLRSLEEAIEAYESAKKLNPKTHDADKGLGLTYALLCQRQKSIELLNTFIANKPTDRDTPYIKRIISEGEKKCIGTE